MASGPSRPPATRAAPPRGRRPRSRATSSVVHRPDHAAAVALVAERLVLVAVGSGRLDRAEAGALVAVGLGRLQDLEAAARLDEVRREPALPVLGAHDVP